MEYVVIQVTLKEKLLGTGSGNLSELEGVLNKQTAKGYACTRSQPPPRRAADSLVATGSKRRWSSRN